MSLDARITRLEKQTNVHGDPIVIVLRNFSGHPPDVYLLNTDHLTPQVRRRLVAQAKRREYPEGTMTILTPELRSGKEEL